ncbi:unnamed protein product, partial [Allacma fusca]
NKGFENFSLLANQVIPKFEYKGNRKINLSEILERHRGISKIMDSLSSSVSPQNILRRIQNPGISLHSCRNANTINDTQLGKNVTHALISAAQIKDIIKNPMVRLFSGENLTEDSVNYHSGHSRRRNDDNKG